MNNMLCKFAACAVLLFFAGTVTAKEWRGIVPLKSTRNDVKRLFGDQKQSSNWLAYYNLRDEIVVFRFQTEACESRVGIFGLGWNVPAGTVVGIGVIPKGAHRREEYLSANDSVVKDHGAGFVYYSDESAGLSVETYKNLVTLVDYYPEANQENLRCPRIQQCCVDVFPRFDEYQKLSFEDEKARLDNFVIHMNQIFGRGVIEVLGPSKRDRLEGMRLAERAKKYLVKKRGLEPQRLLLVDGGFNEGSVTRLSMYSIGGLAGRIYLFPKEDR